MVHGESDTMMNGLSRLRYHVVLHVALLTACACVQAQALGDPKPSAITQDALEAFVEARIQSFHEKRIESLSRLKLRQILRRKNPYLFRAKNITSASELVDALLSAHLSSQEEAMFGALLEQLAIFVCQRTYGGRKSSAEGIDLEFDRGGVRYIVSIKSGPNWGNSSQIAKMKDHFRKAKRILGTNVSATKVVAVNGCCYGRNDRPDKGEYLKLCGQRFWEFVSGEADMYIRIMKAIERKATARNDAFLAKYAKVRDRFASELAAGYCDPQGNLLWERLVRTNCGADAR